MSRFGSYIVLVCLILAISGTALAQQRVFVTSTEHNGAFTGLFVGISGADWYCTNLAIQAGLGGTWKAWLSTSTVDAKDRVGPGPFVLVDGVTVVADDLNDLVDGTLDHAINTDETGIYKSCRVWTGTDENGLQDFAGGNCADWKSTVTDGLTGHSDTSFATTSFWTSADYLPCTNSYSLYCFEAPIFWDGFESGDLSEWSSSVQ